MELELKIPPAGDGTPSKKLSSPRRCLTCIYVETSQS
jgi:hypothetical protein